MKKVVFALICPLIFFVVGCNSIGNGASKNLKFAFESPEYLDIEGDWRIDIDFDQKENSCEIFLDENLFSRLSVRKGRKLGIYLADGIYPMTAPVLRIKLAKFVKELSIEGNSVCNINGFKIVNPLEIDLSDRAVCFFNKCDAVCIDAEVSDNAKLSFKGNIKEFHAEADERAVIEADSVGKFFYEGSDNSICRINSCEEAELELEDNAQAEFKQVKQIKYDLQDEADVKYPVVVPESLKK